MLFYRSLNFPIFIVDVYWIFKRSINSLLLFVERRANSRVSLTRTVWRIALVNNSPCNLTYVRCHVRVCVLSRTRRRSVASDLAILVLSRFPLLTSIRRPRRIHKFGVPLPRQAPTHFSNDTRQQTSYWLARQQNPSMKPLTIARDSLRCMHVCTCDAYVRLRNGRSLVAPSEVVRVQFCGALIPRTRLRTHDGRTHARIWKQKLQWHCVLHSPNSTVARFSSLTFVESPNILFRRSLSL